MPNTYSKKFKKMVTRLIVEQRRSTKGTAQDFNVPLKTVENWITAYNKDNRCFDEDYIPPHKRTEEQKKD